jgi:hypothetical protein
VAAVSDLKDILGFEAFNLKSIGKKIKDNPLRLLYGGIDPASTKVWNTALGRDDEPLVDQWGGASADTYSKAEAAGIDTKAGHNMHRGARVIASMVMGNALGGSSSASASGSGSGSGTGTGGNAFDASKLANISKVLGMFQQQPEQQRDVVQPLEVQYQPDGDPVIVSSRAKKMPGAHASMSELMRRGLSGENVIDQMGVRVGLLKEAGIELDQIEAQLDKLLSGGKK